jgi:hypothetical protein
MQETNTHCNHARPVRGNLWNRAGLWGALLIMGYFLWTEHRAHVIQVLPYLFLLACPLMHLFMHHGHGGHSARGDDQNEGNK